MIIQEKVVELSVLVFRDNIAQGMTGAEALTSLAQEYFDTDLTFKTRVTSLFVNDEKADLAELAVKEELDRFSYAELTAETPSKEAFQLIKDLVSALTTELAHTTGDPEESFTDFMRDTYSYLVQVTARALELSGPEADELDIMLNLIKDGLDLLPYLPEPKEARDKLEAALYKGIEDLTEDASSELSELIGELEDETI